MGISVRLTSNRIGWLKKFSGIKLNNISPLASLVKTCGLLSYCTYDGTDILKDELGKTGTEVSREAVQSVTILGNGSTYLKYTPYANTALTYKDSLGNVVNTVWDSNGEFVIPNDGIVSLTTNDRTLSMVPDENNIYQLIPNDNSDVVLVEQFLPPATPVQINTTEVSLQDKHGYTESDGFRFYYDESGNSFVPINHKAPNYRNGASTLWYDDRTSEETMNDFSGMLLRPDKPSGEEFPKLLPRTLPNGVANTDYEQRVSDDGDVGSLTGWSLTDNQTNTARFDLNLSSIFTNKANTQVDPDNQVLTIGGVEWDLFNTTLFTNDTETFNYNDDGKLYIRVLKSRLSTIDSAGFEAYLQANNATLVYQLATPIDTLNSPFTNPMVDLANVVGKNKIGLVSYLAGGQFSNSVQGFGDLKPDTEYTLSLVVPVGEQYYGNENLFTTTKFTGVGDGTRKSITVTTQNVISIEDTDQYNYNGWRLFKNASGFSSSGNATDLQLELGSTATAYEPYARNDVLWVNAAETESDGCDLVTRQINYDDDTELKPGFRVVDGVVDLPTKEIINTNATPITGAKEISVLTNGASFALSKFIQTASNEQKTVVVKGEKISGSDNLTVQIKTLDNSTVLITQGLSVENQEYRFSFTPTDNGYQVLFFGSLSSAGVQEKRYYDFAIYEGDYVTGNPPLPASGQYVSGNSQVKQIPMFKADGVDTYGILPNHPALDPVGTEDFAMGFVIRTGATLQTGYIRCKNELSSATMQYGIYFNESGTLMFVLEGLAFVVGGEVALQANTFYQITATRKSSVLVVKINKVEVYNEFRGESLTSRPNTRLLARSANAEGTAHAFYYNGHLGLTSFTKTNIDQWEANFNAEAKRIYGL